MLITIRAPALIGTALLLLTACGGGGGGETPASPSPSPTPGPVTPPSPSPTPADSNRDYQLPYRIPMQGLATVPSGNLAAAPTTRSGTASQLIAVIPDGEWSTGVVQNERPHTLLYLDGNVWKSFALRSAAPQNLVTTAVSETRPICTIRNFYLAPDYATPANSFVGYFTPGTDGQCRDLADPSSPDDDVFTTFTSAASRTIDLGNDYPLHSFYGADGQLTGHLAQVGQDLRLYAAGSSNFTIAATGVRNRAALAAAGAASAGSVWLQWDNGSNRGIYRIDANAARTGPIYTVPTTEGLGGVADASAMYLVRRTASSNTQIVRVPFTGSASTVGSYSVSYSVFAESDDTLFLGAGNDLFVLPKAGGTPTRISGLPPDVVDIDNLTVTAANQLLFNHYTQTNGQLNSRAILVNAQGQVTEMPGNSEWVSFQLAPRNLSRMGVTRTARAVRVESYTGPYIGQGHIGGNLVSLAFGSGTRQTLGQVNSRGRLFPRYASTPAFLQSFTTIGGSSGNTADVFGFDLDKPQVVRLTDTPTISETPH